MTLYGGDTGTMTLRWTETRCPTLDAEGARVAPSRHQQGDRAANLPSGKRFTVRAEGLSDAKPYVAKVTLNGKPLTRAFLRHEEIIAGGELVFTMSATPNKTWATKPADRPTSMTGYR